MIVTKFRTQFLPIKVYSDGQVLGVLLYPGGPMLDYRQKKNLYATGGYKEFAHAFEYVPMEESVGAEEPKYGC
jgi:hypothetical protein